VDGASVERRFADRVFGGLIMEAVDVEAERPFDRLGNVNSLIVDVCGRTSTATIAALLL
jgi:hypothetical protein